MAQFMRKAMVYLGLVDTDDDDDYEDDFDEPQTSRGRQPAYADSASNGTVDHAPTTTVRPLPRDEAFSTPSTISTRPAAVVRPIVPAKTAKVNVVAPIRFSDAQEIGDFVKSGSPVIVNLQASERDLSRRMIDFCSGVTYAIGGSMEKVAEQVFLLTPSNVEVSAEERQRLQERGLFQR
ncbi:MAG TPA: cell division protein SepF [Acidimicrobiales bacterium]|nr:cell division protein SepF [Acidimicrobiales bacterium]